jgi:Cu2+-exporting ATPase
MVANTRELSSSTPAACAHCGLPVATAGATFCCSGCEAVYGLLHAEQLTRYYELQGQDGCPVPQVRDERADRKWLEPLEARAAAGGVQRLRLDVQGLHCSACVWLIEQLFARHPGGLRADINPALGAIDLVFDQRFPLRAWVVQVERFGYQLGPALKRSEARTSSLLWRLGVCAALAMNAMIFAVAFYAGLAAGPTFRLFQALVFGLSTLSVLVGGSVFIRSAWQALRQRVLHMDLPIALGILLAYTSSTLAYLAGRERGVYFDTLAVFITLMLLGRFLQERVLERNRRQLLDSDGADGLYTRRIRDGAVQLIRCTEVRTGDTLLLSPGDLFCVEARLDGSATASCSLDWISGESAPRRFAAGDTIPAGAFNVGDRPLRVIAAADFVASALTELLRVPTDRPLDAARATPWWRRLARVYVSTVLAVAATTLGAWLLFGHDAARALDVTAAVLIVTCPCAFGIATPLAYELAQAGLRRAGLLVRSASFLDRAAAVHRVVFDKTGTLTTGALRLADASGLDDLAAEERDAMYTLAVSSAHPKSMAVAAALAARDARFVPGLEVEERPGRGTLARHQGHELRLGAPMWAAASPYPPGTDVLFSVDGDSRAFLATEEEARPDAAVEVRHLAADGLEVHVLSGDSPAKTLALATRLHIPASHALGGCSPQDKAEWLALHDRQDTLMIGDGINDAIAVERAFCSGTPAIDRPFMPARSDFYFVTAGLRPVRLALLAARALARLNRRNLRIAVAYNVVTVALAAAGLMSPLLCALVMPLSSLTVVLSSTHAFSRRSPLWRS